jgi:hypothetical protein
VEVQDGDSQVPPQPHAEAGVAEDLEVLPILQFPQFFFLTFYILFLVLEDKVPPQPPRLPLLAGKVLLACYHPLQHRIIF